MKLFAAEVAGLTPVNVWVRQGREFKPSIQFIGMLADRNDADLVRRLLRQYGSHVVAYADQSMPGVTCFPGCFSVELQFADSPDGEKARQECSEAYEVATSST